MFFVVYSLLFHGCVKTLAKGAFMHLVSHRIITPLNILSWTMILQKMEVTEYKAAYTTMINLLVYYISTHRFAKVSITKNIVLSPTYIIKDIITVHCM